MIFTKICLNKKITILVFFLLLLVGSSLYSTKTILLLKMGYRSKAAQPQINNTITTLNGTLVSTHYDDFNGETSVSTYDLLTDEDQGRITIINPSDEIIKMKPGSKISIRGRSNTLSIQSESVNAVQLIQNPSVISTTGSKKVAIILIGFQDMPFPTDITKNEMKDYFNTTVKSYFLENSFNLLSYESDSYGPYSLPINNTCDYTLLADAVSKNISDISFSQYDVVEFIIDDFPAGCNKHDGLATMLKLGGVLKSTIIIESSYAKVVSMVAHEIGHTLGATHAMTYDCGGKSVGNFTDCTLYNYAKYFDTMGRAMMYQTAQFSGYFKQFFGWIPQNNVRTVVQSGTYTLYPTENKPRANEFNIIKVPIPNTNYSYYLEYRMPIGGDESFIGYYKQQGILISIAPLPGENSTVQLDTTPVSSLINDTGDPVLKPGKSFYDPINGIRFSIPEESIAYENDGIKVVISISTSTSLVRQFTNLKADFSDPNRSKARFNFSYPPGILPSSFTINLSIDSKMGVGTYNNFAAGKGSPIIESNPTKWEQYACGKTLYWQITSLDGMKSPIQQTVVCGK